MNTTCQDMATNEGSYMNARTGKKLRVPKTEKKTYPQGRHRIRCGSGGQSKALTKGIGYARNNALNRSKMGTT
jgi:hypothetical protein